MESMSHLSGLLVVLLVHCKVAIDFAEETFTEHEPSVFACISSVNNMLFLVLYVNSGAAVGSMSESSGPSTPNFHHSEVCMCLHLHIV